LSLKLRDTRVYAPQIRSTCFTWDGGRDRSYHSRIWCPLRVILKPKPPFTNRLMAASRSSGARSLNETPGFAPRAFSPACRAIFSSGCSSLPSSSSCGGRPVHHGWGGIWQAGSILKVFWLLLPATLILLRWADVSSSPRIGWEGSSNLKSFLAKKEAGGHF